MGERADRDQLDAGGGDPGHRLEVDAPGCLEPRRRPGGVAGANRGPQLTLVHVVEQQPVGACGQRLGDLVGVAALDFDLELGVGGGGELDGAADPAGDRDVVLLDQDRVVEAHAMVAPAAGGHRALLERAQTGGRLAGVEDHGTATADRVDVTRREGRHPGKVGEQVERSALAGEQAPGRAADQRDLGGDRVAPLALDHQPVERVGARLSKDLLGDVEAEHHTGLLLNQVGAGTGRGRDRRLRGHVTGAEVLGERPADEVGELRGRRQYVSRLNSDATRLGPFGLRLIWGRRRLWP